MTLSRIAVLIPVYNNQSGLDVTIKSVEDNAIEGLELVVVDDGSFVPMVLKTTLKHTLMRLDKNVGIEGALNKGLEYIISTGIPYIARIDANDIAVNNRFVEQVTFLENNPDVGLVGSWVEKCSHGSVQFIKKFKETDKDIRLAMHLNNAVPHSGAMMRTAIVATLGRYSTHYPAAEDYDLFFRILEISKSYNIPRVLMRIDIGNPNGISNKKLYRQMHSKMRIQIRYFNFSNIYSYYGILRSMVRYITPNSIVQKFHVIMNR